MSSKKMALNAELHKIACEFFAEAAIRYFNDDKKVRSLLEIGVISTKLVDKYVHAFLPLWQKNGTQLIFFEIRIPTSPPIEPEVLKAMDLTKVDWSQVDFEM